MTSQATNRDVQRLTFVESLHSSLKKQASIAICDHQKMIVIASSYIDDGLEEGECVELLLLDGISRNAAEGYVAMAMNNQEEGEDLRPEYSFQFEDDYGKTWSSYDISKTVRATTDDEAWDVAEAAIESSNIVESYKVISVTRIS